MKRLGNKLVNTSKKWVNDDDDDDMVDGDRTEYPMVSRRNKNCGLRIKIEGHSVERVPQFKSIVIKIKIKMLKQRCRQEHNEQVKDIMGQKKF